MIQQEANIDKKDQIVMAAEALFSEKDFDAVSVRDIAKAASVNISMISYYFGSKEKLLEEVVNRRIETTQSKLQSIIKEGISSWDTLVLIIDLYVEKLMDNRPFQKLVNRELSNNTRPQLRDFMIGKMKSNRDYIIAVIKEGIAKKEFRAEVDTELAMLTLFSTLHQMIGTSYHTCNMLHKNSEEELFTPEFKGRVKAFFKDLMAKYLLLNQ